MAIRIRTEYRYVHRVPGVCGGRPVIRGTRTPVKAVVGYYKMGLSVEEILASLPHLTPAQVHDALTYYYDHQAEIEQDIEDNRVQTLVERYGLRAMPDGRLVLENGDGD